LANEGAKFLLVEVWVGPGKLGPSFWQIMGQSFWHQAWQMIRPTVWQQAWQMMGQSLWQQDGQMIRPTVWQKAAKSGVCRVSGRVPKREIMGQGFWQQAWQMKTTFVGQMLATNFWKCTQQQKGKHEHKLANVLQCSLLQSAGRKTSSSFLESAGKGGVARPKAGEQGIPTGKAQHKHH
jgi:hypothetical protein